MQRSRARRPRPYDNPPSVRLWPVSNTKQPSGATPTTPPPPTPPHRVCRSGAATTTNTPPAMTRTWTAFDSTSRTTPHNGTSTPRTPKTTWPSREAAWHAPRGEASSLPRGGSAIPAPIAITARPSGRGLIDPRLTPHHLPPYTDAQPTPGGTHGQHQQGAVAAGPPRPRRPPQPRTRALR